MNMTFEDSQLLAELCEQHGVSADKVLKLLDTVRDYEFKDRRIRLKGTVKGDATL